MISRRSFIKSSAILGAGISVPVMASTAHSDVIASFNIRLGEHEGICQIRFNSPMRLTHSDNLILPMSKDIQAIQGDVATFAKTGENTHRCVNYSKAHPGTR